MFEQLLVGLIVAVAGVYASWQICPASVRVALVKRLQKSCENSAARSVLPGLARSAAVPNGACASCGARNRCPIARSAAASAAVNSATGPANVDE